MTFEKLYAVIRERKEKLPEGSSTTRMMIQGFGGILPKLNEEAFEVGLALERDGAEDVALEVSQCFYYLVCLGVFIGAPLESLRLAPETSAYPEDKHELAKLICRLSAGVCHTPTIDTLNLLPGPLMKALELSGASRASMFDCL